MASIKVAQQIDAPLERVFDVVSDIPEAANTVTAITKIEMLSEGPVGIGTRWRETRTLFGRDATEEMEFTEFERPCRYVVEAESCGCHYRTEYLFHAQGDGTCVSMEMQTRPLTFFARGMSLIGFLMKGVMVKCFEADLKDCKRLCEAKG